MGSFNLGRIKGAKGDRGETGPKGDTGAKGEKGDTGDSGRDGLTPVFKVGGTATLAPGEKAYVEIDTENPAEPVIYFRIPAGFDGKDASGDMLASVYDSEGIKEDIYTYANNLFDNCVKTVGGNLIGALKATETSLLDGSVRNISARSSLPESGAEGDICIIVADNNSKRLEECEEGTVFLIEENGKEQPYIIVAKNHYQKNSVTLIRKYLSPHRGRFSNPKKTAYAMCEADVFLESMFRNSFSDELKKNMIAAEVETAVYRYCFLLSKRDFMDLNYLSIEANRKAGKAKGSDYEQYITRSIDSQGSVVTVGTTGSFSTVSQTTELYYRPAIVLPSYLEVVNTVYDELSAIKLHETKPGIYMYIQGEWKECACL